MNKETLAIDIDDVKADFMPNFLAFYNKTNNTSFKFEDIHSYDLSKVFGIGVDVSVDKMHEFFDSPDFEKIAPIEGAIEAISKLKEKYNLIIITARPKSIEGKTRKWIEEHFPDTFSDIYFTNQYSKKSKDSEKSKEKYEICLEKNAKTIIEDSLRTALGCAANGIKVLLFEKPWNKNNRPEKMPKYITLVSSWQEVLKNLKI